MLLLLRVLRRQRKIHSQGELNTEEEGVAECFQQVEVWRGACDCDVDPVSSDKEEPQSSATQQLQSSRSSR